MSRTGHFYNVSAPFGEYYVYAMVNSRIDMYIGFTSDLHRRVQYHQSGNGALPTRQNGPWSLAYYEVWTTEEDAIRREKDLQFGKPYKDLQNQIAERQLVKHGAEPIKTVAREGSPAKYKVLM